MGPRNMTPRRSLPRVERCSPLGAPFNPCQEAGGEPEEHRRNSTKQKRDVKQGISVGSRIVRLMNNETKNQKEDCCSHEGRESDDKNAVAIVKIVPRSGCASQDSDALISQRGKQPRGHPMKKRSGINMKSTVHSVHATSSKYPGKERTIAGKNTSQTSTSAKSLRYRI